MQSGHVKNRCLFSLASDGCVFVFFLKTYIGTVPIRIEIVFLRLNNLECQPYNTARIDNVVAKSFD